MAAAHKDQKNLSPAQQQELVEYVKRLTKQRISPTRELIQDFGTTLARKPVSESGVTRFINANTHLLLHSSTPVDHLCHNADQGLKYKQDYDQLYYKIRHYKVEERHIYNINKKGFIIGVIGCMNRVFNKLAYMAGAVKSFTHNCNRE